MNEEKDYPPYLDYQKPYKPQTNAQKIRSMSDEELEEGIVRLSLGYEPWCDHHCKMNGDDDCNRCLRSWLQQPARDTTPHCTKKSNN